MNKNSQLVSFNSALDSPLIIGILVGITALAAWWSSSYEINAVYALKGFSPIAWVYQMAHPGNFVSDFPGGAENYRFSAFIHIYRLAYAVGIAPQTLVPVVMAFEIVLLSYALFALSRTLAPDAPLAVLALVIIFAISSSARNVNLANFTQPYFTGQYYNVADALRILGLAMVLKCRPIPAAVLFAASFTTHATMGLTGMACALAMQLVRPREIFTRQYLVAATVFLVLAGGWVFVQFGDVATSAGEIPLQIWIEMTRAFNYHWYPVDNGILTVRARDLFLPFLSFLVLLAYYWPFGKARSEISTKASAGVLAMLVFTIAGLAFSIWLPMPLLIKLALHRANDLVVLIGLVYVVAGLWRDLKAGGWWQRALATTVLLSPWFALPFPLLVSLLLVAPAGLRVISRRNASRGDLIATALVLGVVVICGLYYVADIWVGLDPRDMLKDPRMLAPLVVFIVIGTLFAGRFGQSSLKTLILAAAVMLALNFANETTKKRDVERGLDYLHAQEWARENTSTTALFMTDPTIYYGWRDFSQRSSFGNMREWLHTSWLYDSNAKPYKEGLRRFGEFDIDLQPYLQLQPPISAVRQLTEELRKRYYEASDDWRIDLARRYDIDFIVLQRRDMVAPTNLPVVYQNDNFVIVAAGDSVRGAGRQ